LTLMFARSVGMCWW